VRQRSLKMRVSPSIVTLYLLYEVPHRLYISKFTRLCSFHAIARLLLECASIVEEYTTNFHSDGIPVQSGSALVTPRD